MRKDDDGSVDAELTPVQVRKLQRRIADLDDATRYMLVSHMGARFVLYYDVSEDVYVMNDPTGATLFKRRKAAIAIKSLLHDGIQVISCKSKRQGAVRVPILNSIQGRLGAIVRASSRRRRRRRLRVSA